MKDEWIDVIARRALFPTKQSPNHAGIASGEEQERPRNDMLENYRMIVIEMFLNFLAEFFEVCG